MTGINRSRAYKIFEYLQKADYPRKDDIVLYAAGFTYKKRDYITSLENKMSIEVKKTTLPVYPGLMFKILCFLPKPNYFVIKIKDAKYIRKVFDALDDFLLIRFFIFRELFEGKFSEEIGNVDSKCFPDSIKLDEKYLVYGVDCDNQDCSDTEVMEIVSYGINAPKELLNFI